MATGPIHNEPNKTPEFLLPPTQEAIRSTEEAIAEFSKITAEARRKADEALEDFDL